MLARLVSVVVVLLLAAGAANAVVFYSDNFNANPRRNNATPLNWTVTSGSVNLVNRFAGQGIQVDMDGGSTRAARIQTNQIFNFVRGSLYTLSFTYGKTVAASQQVSFGVGSFTSSLTVGGAATPALLQHAFSFVVTSGFTSRLAFWSNFGNRSGVLIDNVQFSVTPVPVPSTLGLLVVGLCGIGALGRSRGRV